MPGVELPASISIRAHAAPTGYFSLMRIPVVLGRDFNPAGGNPPGAIVIGADLARRLWGEAGPIGRRIVSVGGFQGRSGTLTVIGVVDNPGASGNARDDRIFVSTVRVTGHFLIRTQGPAKPIIPVIRSVANSDAPELSLVSARTIAAIENGQRNSFMNAIAAAGGSGAFSAPALGDRALCRGRARGRPTRARGIGIRAALGADHHRILGMFLRRGLKLSLGGVFIGLTLSVVGLRLLAALSGDEAPSGTAAVAAMVTVVVVGVTLLATWIPARRATKINPLEALRVE